MKKCRRFLKPHSVCLPLFILITTSIISTTTCINSVKAVTVSAGEPFRGKLVNGVFFPSHLIACRKSNTVRSYATPETTGALLEAFEVFRRKYPDSCDIVLGDFSVKGGGRLRGHESHQNGRDVDVGLFAKGNVALSRFAPMNAGTLDVPKTWHLLECIIKTQLVECLYMDRAIQAILYRHALNEGLDPDYLSYVFEAAGGGGNNEHIVQHEPGHSGHMHVRFFAPWSSLAGQLKHIDSETRKMIEVGQQSFYAPGAELSRKHGHDLKELAQFFQVKTGGLGDWSNLPKRQTGLGEFLVMASTGLNWNPSMWQATLRGWIGARN